MILILYVLQCICVQAAEEKKLPQLIIIINMTKKKLNKPQTFHVIIERTLMTPSDAPKATRGTSPAIDLERNSILQETTIKERITYDV